MATSRSRKLTRLELQQLEARAVPATFTVTNTGDNGGVNPAPLAGTGTLRQVIVDANATGGTDTIAFNIPTAMGSAASIVLAASLPAITETVIIDGTTQTDTNTLPLGAGATGTTVGVGPDGVANTGDEVALAVVNAPDVEIVGTNSMPIGLDVQGNASNVVIRGLAMYGFGVANIGIGQNVNGLLIEQNVLGSSATSFSDPGAGVRTLGVNILGPQGGLNNGIIRNNLIGFAGGHGISLPGGSANFQFFGNEIRSNGLVVVSDGLDLSGANTVNNIITGNLIEENTGFGIDLLISNGNHTVSNNTISRNGSTSITAGIVSGGPNNTLSHNIISENVGAGVLIASSEGTTITQNSIFDNTSIGIDLLMDYGVTINDLNDADSGGNTLLNFPILEEADISGDILELSGFARPGSIIEIFIAAPDPTGFGEGERYLLTLTEGSNDLDNTIGTYGPGPINGLNQGTDTTNRFLFQIPLSSLPAGYGLGALLTSTATSARSTSEFSGNVIVTSKAFSISGNVYRDLNNNGLFEPLQAETRIMESTTIELLDATNSVIATTTTTTGQYQFNNLSAGIYSVRELTQPTGFLDGRDTPGIPYGGVGTGPTDSRAPRDSETISEITLLARSFQNGINYNFGELPPANIGDFVWDDVNQNGRQDRGEKGFASVSVTLNGTDDTGATVNLSTSTNGNGLYLFEDLRPGTYQVQFVAPVFYQFTVANATIATDVTDSDANRTTGATISFTLLVGETDLTWDAGLIPIPPDGRIHGYVWVDGNNNGIRETGERPIPGTRILLSGTALNGTPISASTTTNNRGYYEFKGLNTGNYTVTEIQPANYYDGQEENAETGNFPPPTILNDEFVNIILIRDQLRGDFNFGELPLNSSLKGFVYHDRNSDGFRNPGEPGIFGVQITLTGTDIVGNSVNVTTRTDSTGAFSFQNMLAGNYTLTEAQPPGFLDGLDRAGSAGGVVGNDVISDINLASDVNGVNYLFGERLNSVLPITKRALLTNYNATLRGGPLGSGRAVGNELSSLSGLVYVDANNNGRPDAHERRLAGIRIELQGVSITGEQVRRFAMTNAQGRYRFYTLPPGTYSILQSQPAGFTTSSTRIGNLGGIVAPEGITDIVLGERTAGVGYQFGVRRVPLD
jgi:parallel beta-helix repeat protein